MVPLTVPMFQLLLRCLLSALLGPDGQQATPLTRRAAVRLSALRKLGPLDPLCDQRGRERKFCQRELRPSWEPKAGGVRGEPRPKCSSLTGGLISPGRSAAGNESTSAADLGTEVETLIDTPAICPKDRLPHCDKDFLDAGVRLKMDEECLNGPQRLVADGLMTQKECDVLIKFGAAGFHGNGHYGDPHPMTRKELFAGFRTMDLMGELKNSEEIATAMTVMLAASDRARLYSEAYFRLKRRLYMHLVQTNCRTAEQDSTTNRTDMSHPIHADNCQYQDNASCPALNWDFSWRDFSAAVYLNDDAHGGELVFATTPRTSIRVFHRPAEVWTTGVLQQPKSPRCPPRVLRPSVRPACVDDAHQGAARSE
ncbi:prolyl 3-hydroxylase 1-like isoform X2 [Dermacentor albipictus]|uniref:prolyl 3-hydroxylase 1-like isoform X2 n=1 Tax=Dermacentor albipictus TaxID=60249 RepID=UPI0038FC2BBC